MIRKTQLSPRKQPLQARAHATRESIVEAAAHIVERRGLEGFNTNAVAERAGVSIGSLYQYYPNKDALMAALVGRQQALLKSALADKLAQAKDATLPQGIRVLVRAAVDLQKRAPRLAAAIDYEESRLPVDDVLVEAARGLDAVLLDFLVHRFETVAPARLVTMARTTRSIARAIIDEFSDREQPDFSLAEDEAVVAVTGYLAEVAAVPLQH